MKNLRALLIATACLLPTLGQAATIILNPTADAYIQNGNNAAKNYGTATTLNVQTNATAASNYDSYLKFDAAAAAGQITSAKLRLYASLSKSGSVSSSAYAVTNTSWGETTLTWNNRPALGSSLGSVTVSGTSYAWKEIDVTAYVQSEKSAGRNLITLGLHNAATSSVYVRANSRNATSNRPELVIVTNAAPTVSFTSPASGSVYTAPASVTLTASAADSDGSIAKVEFYNGASLIGTGTFTGGSYTLAWNNVATGIYSLIAKATDNAGAVTSTAPVTITVNPPPNVAPSVSLSTPADGSTHVSGEAIVITANAADSDGSIASVAFYANGTLLYTVTGTPYKLTTSLAAGSYSLTAVATDDEGEATTSVPVSITVTPAPNVPPTVSMTGPADGSTYAAPASVILAADAADSDGSIVAVEFYNGATLIASLTTPPYTYTWSDVPLGNYSVRARAVDDRGGATYSNTIAVNVNASVATGVYYLYADHLNTPRVITDNSNKVVWRWDSDPFGADAANEDPDGDGVKFGYNLRFPGQYYDRETGLHYNYFRDYDPGTGRYVEADPIGLDGGMNLYSYVEGNPMSFIDPSGLVKLYGSWCGPDWTGGFPKQYDELDDAERKAVLPPIDGLDSCCRTHDITYASCRKQFPCDAEARKRCFDQADRSLSSCSANSRGDASSQILILGNAKKRISNYMKKSNPDPGPNSASCGCSKN